MIGYLSGQVLRKAADSIVVLVGGIGYKVNVLPQLSGEYNSGDKLELYTHQYVREDELALYGFVEPEQQRMFELLISVSGIGPKLAFNILATTTPDELRAAVAKTDLSVLSRIPGIGKKTASKLMLELSNKLDIEQDVGKMLFSAEDELAAEALANLGFKPGQARQAIREAARREKKLEDKIRAGLQYLNK